jgi:O-Antigen ligase
VPTQITVPLSTTPAHMPFGLMPASEHAERGDAWPHTTRALPWLLAGFLVMLFLVPIQDIRLPITLPVDAKLDRFVLGGIALVWLAALLAGGRGAPRTRRSIVNFAVISFAALAAASVLLNMQVLATSDDLTLAIKKLALLAAFLMLFYIASTSLRSADLRGFGLLIVGLASLTAVGTIWEYRMGTNLFYDITAKVLPPGFSLLPEAPDPEFGRPAVTGPTQHGLAVTTMLALTLPFAIVGIVQSRERRNKLAYATATALILAGTVATVRKTALIVPAASLIVLLAYWRREMLRLAPLGLVLVVVMQLLSPGALTSIRYELQAEKVTGGSTEGRTEDYDAIAPDVKTHLATGRGYGTYDSHKYRLLDNQYLVLLIEVGFLGIAAYLAIMLAVVLVGHRTIRSGDPSRAPPAVAAAAASAGFFVCNGLFDVLAFPQAPYLFFFVAALAVISSAPDSGGESGSRHLPERRLGVLPANASALSVRHNA